jgi:glyoxylase-like metal-dependent hydrolase (beta-lactamase superfamily II)
MQIIPDVYLVNGFPYGQHQNGYLIRLGESYALIDSGDLEHPTLGLVLYNCARWGISPEQISHLLITHAHFDHSSHAAALQRRGVTLVGSAGTAAAVASGDDRCVGYAVHGRFEPCELDVVVADDDELTLGETTVRCIAAPGHADSCIIYEIDLRGERLWFVGDVVLTGADCQSVELGWNGGPDYDRSTYVETLRRLAHMDCDHLFPGHGPAGIGLGHKLVEDAYTQAMMTLR